MIAGGKSGKAERKRGKNAFVSKLLCAGPVKRSERSGLYRCKLNNFHMLAPTAASLDRTDVALNGPHRLG